MLLARRVYCKCTGFDTHLKRYWLGQSIETGSGWDNILQQVLSRRSIAAGNYLDSLWHKVLDGKVYCKRYWLGQSLEAGTGRDTLFQQVLAGVVYRRRYWLEQSIAAGTDWYSLF
jgi:hypothetical protein